MSRQVDRGFALDRSLGYVVNRAAARLEAALARELAPHGVTPQQWAVLNRLWEQDGLSQVELAERTFKDPPNTARILERLERKGLVTRAPDPADRRAQRVSLTEAGRALRLVLVPLAQALLARALRGVDDAQHEAAMAVLRRVDANLD
ncbi:MAG TPA: MarR family transcriptional regulator [Solirubrobacteraceae bacterium]|jgi:DNA-binding MarR family transcriptional regulator